MGSTWHPDSFIPIRPGPARAQEKEEKKEKKAPAKKKKKLGDGSGVSNKIDVSVAWCGVVRRLCLGARAGVL